MSKLAVLIAAATLLVAEPALASDYKCADKDTSTKLNDYDIEIKDRADVVAEIRAEIQESGGSTEQHKQALQTFEDKLAKATADRAALLKECGAESTP
ncbi:MAG: hypothetical protein ACK4TP_14020 [Hyphomicrobium sp.]|jgi:hypothetical protein